MPEFRITFGIRYRHEPHPRAALLDIPISPDGYIALDADSEEQAREGAMRLFGRAWAFIYAAPFDEAKWARLHPLGELARRRVMPVTPRHREAAS